MITMTGRALFCSTGQDPLESMGFQSRTRWANYSLGCKSQVSTLRIICESRSDGIYFELAVFQRETFLETAEYNARAESPLDFQDLYRDNEQLRLQHP